MPLSVLAGAAAIGILGTGALVGTGIQTMFLEAEGRYIPEESCIRYNEGTKTYESLRGVKECAGNPLEQGQRSGVIMTL